MLNVRELSREKLIQLKQSYYTMKNESTSYWELADIDNLVSDEEIIEAYDGISFTEEDFFEAEESDTPDITLENMIKVLAETGNGE